MTSTRCWMKVPKGVHNIFLLNLQHSTLLASSRLQCASFIVFCFCFHGHQNNVVLLKLFFQQKKKGLKCRRFEPSHFKKKIFLQLFTLPQNPWFLLFSPQTLTPNSPIHSLAGLPQPLCLKMFEAAFGGSFYLACGLDLLPQVFILFPFHLWF